MTQQIRETRLRGAAYLEDLEVLSDGTNRSHSGVSFDGGGSVHRGRFDTDDGGRPEPRNDCGSDCSEPSEDDRRL